MNTSINNNKTRFLRIIKIFVMQSFYVYSLVVANPNEDTNICKMNLAYHIYIHSSKLNNFPQQ